MGLVGQERSKLSMDVGYRIVRKLDSVDSILMWKCSEKATYSEFGSKLVSGILLTCYDFITTLSKVCFQVDVEGEYLAAQTQLFSGTRDP